MTTQPQTKGMASAVRHPRPSGIRLSTYHERWIYGIGAALWASGILWLVFHYYFRVQGPFGEEAHPLTAWWLRLHGAAAMAFLIVFGTLLPIHVQRAWQLRRNRSAGLALFALVTALLLSGYGLYYASSEALRPLISGMHWSLGLLGLPMLATHVVLGKHKGISASPRTLVKTCGGSEA